MTAGRSGRGFVRTLRRHIRRWLPVPVLLWIGRLRPQRHRTQSPCVSDVRNFRLDDATTLHVYWLDAPLGAGPAASLYVAGEEVMRFDCLAGANAHLHVNVHQSALLTGRVPRLFLPEADMAQHIERACFELRHNLPAYAMATSLDPRVTRHLPDDATLLRASEILREEMADLARRHTVI